MGHARKAVDDKHGNIFESHVSRNRLLKCYAVVMLVQISVEEGGTPVTVQAGIHRSREGGLRKYIIYTVHQSPTAHDYSLVVPLTQGTCRNAPCPTVSPHDSSG